MTQNGKLLKDIMDTVFAEGGQSTGPKPKKGGLATIYVDNPNDPRLRAYSDSLYLHNQANSISNLLRNKGFDVEKANWVSKTGTYYNNPRGVFDMKKMLEAGRRLGFPKPIGTNVATRPISNSGAEFYFIDTYAKPKQKVEYRKPQPVVVTQKPVVQQPVVEQPVAQPQVVAPMPPAYRMRGATPVYGPSQSLIGMYDDDVNEFYPDYDNTAARANVNQQDSDLISNTQMLQNYLKSKNINPKVMEKKANGGQMIRRADGSYSRRGLWDNIRANRGSGKKPTKEMLEQERKIKSQEKANGGNINNNPMYSFYDFMAMGGTNNPGFRALPDHVQVKILNNMSKGGSTFSGNAWYGGGGMYPRYDEAGPVPQWHSEWASDPMMAEQFGYEYQEPAQTGYMVPAEEIESDVPGGGARPLPPELRGQPSVASGPQKPAKAAAAPRKQNSAQSIVDFLNSQGAKSDFATRKEVAEKIYGFKNYTGTAEQNKRLLAIMSGKMNPNAGSNVMYNPNDGNVVRQGWNQNYDSRVFQFGPMPKRETAPVPVTVSPNEDVKNDTPKELPKKSKADQYIENDPYVFAEESDPRFIKAIDAPFTWLRNMGARVALDQDPVAVGELLLAGLMSRGLVGKTKITPYGLPKGPKSLPGGANKALPGPGPRQITAPRPATSPRPGNPSGGYMEFGKDYSPRLGPHGFQTGTGMRSPGFPMYSSGGYVGQEIEITDPEQLRMLALGGYTYEII